MNAMRDQIEYARGYHLPDRAGLVNELRSMQARGDAVVMLDKVRLRLAIRKAERQLAIERIMVDQYAKFSTENLLSAASRIERNGGSGRNVVALSRFRHV